VNKWISVKKSLPEPYKRVLICSDEGIHSGYRDDEEKYTTWQCDPIGSFASDGCVHCVTHWMDLPPLPEVENE